MRIRKMNKYAIWLITTLSVLIFCPKEINAVENPVETVENCIYRSNIDDKYIDIDIPNEYNNINLSNKTYMCYTKITNKDSAQYQYINESGEIKVDENGFLITADGYIGVAMGSYFGEIGSKYIVYLDSGNNNTRFIKVIKVEAKADSDTDSFNFMGNTNNDIIEFVVDTNSEYMQNRIWQNGYIFGGNFNNYYKFNGNVNKIIKVI